MTVWWNLFWKILIEYLQHVMKYQNVILTLHFTLQDENIQKRKMWRKRQNKDQETLSFPCLVIWRRLDNLQIKQTSNQILNAVKYCGKTRYLNGKIHSCSESAINVT